MVTVDIRSATEPDLPAIAELARGLVVMHHSRDSGRFFLPDDIERGYVWWFERELRRPQAVILVAVREGQIVGYCYGTRESRDFNLLVDEHGVIHDLFVLPAARGQGTAARLLQAMIAALESLGAPRVLLYTMVDNLAAQAVFKSAGFRPTMLEMTRNATDATPITT